MQPEDVPLNHSVAPGVYRDRKAWRTVINCVLDIPGVGSAQRHVLKLWPFDTPIDEMQAWRREAKPRIEAELQERIDAPLRELEKLKAAKSVRRLNPKMPAASFAELREDLEAARQQIVELKETAAKLHDALRLERRRAELAEQSAREVAGRAYRFAAAAGARR